jgi:trk system potassium uptake protein TrkH
MRSRLGSLGVFASILSSLVALLGAVLLIPLAVSLLYREFDQGLSTIFAFLLPSALCLVVGLLLQFLLPRKNPSASQSVLICAVSWILFSAIGAVPFVIGIGSGYLDAYFETMSGFTTTGITMYTGLDHMPASILFWRALTQWLGGLGILTFFLAVTYRGGGAHLLFSAESHKIDVGRPVPGLFNTVRILWGLYSAFTVVIIVALIAAGMPAFDSICHSFTALSTGGFSPYDASIEHYRIAGYAGYIWIDYILILGMILGGTNFLIHYRLWRREWKALIDNIEMRYWWIFIGGFALLIMAERAFKGQFGEGLSGGSAGGLRALEENFRLTLFQVVSIITTTGFGTRDIGSSFFGQFARQLFLIMMVIGGCVGSTGGGIKVLRVAVLSKLARRQLYRLAAPSGSVSDITIDGKVLEEDEVQRVAALFFAWMGLLVAGGLITAFLSRQDALSSFSGMFSALGNIGPCYIPVAEMNQLHPFIKIVYIFGMLAGRLEILPVLLLFNRRAW